MRPLLACFTLLLFTVTAAAQQFHPKVVIVTFFEIGADTGDTPGELQLWVERDHLARIIDVPGMTHPVRANADASEIAVVVGPGQIRPAANLTALGYDPRFDLHDSFWLVNGIAGISPRDASLGSAVWTDFVVNGDLVHAIDPREMPPNWQDPFYPIDKSHPYEQPRVDPASPAVKTDDIRHWSADRAYIDWRGIVVQLNPTLLNWAFALTRDLKLSQTPPMQALGSKYTGFPAASKLPCVLMGANLATETFWHGTRYDDWAHRFVPYMTDGRAQFMTTAMNDSGALVAIAQLTSAHRADLDRVLLLRTGSNFDRQPPGITAEASARSEKHAAFTAYAPALESAYIVGSTVTKAILSGQLPASAFHAKERGPAHEAGSAAP